MPGTTGKPDKGIRAPDLGIQVLYRMHDTALRGTRSSLRRWPPARPPLPCNNTPYSFRIQPGSAVLGLLCYGEGEARRLPVFTARAHSGAQAVSIKE